MDTTTNTPTERDTRRIGRPSTPSRRRPGCSGSTGDDLPRDPRRRLPRGPGAVPLRHPRRRGRADGRAGRRDRRVRGRRRDRDRPTHRPRGRPRDRRSADEPQRRQRRPTCERAGRGELDDLAAVPDEVLSRPRRPPRDVPVGGHLRGPAGHGPARDRRTGTLAARLCAGCPVQRECLELELRTAGAETVGRVGRAERGRPPRPARRRGRPPRTAAAVAVTNRTEVSSDERVHGDRRSGAGGAGRVPGVVLVAVAGRVLLAAAVIAGIQWLVIHYLASNATLVWVVLGVPALLAGYTLADALTGSTGLGSVLRRRRRRWSAMSADRHPTTPGTAPHRRNGRAGQAAVAAVAARGRDRAGPGAGRGRRVLLRDQAAARGPRRSTRLRAPGTVLRWLVRNSVLYPLTGAWVLARRVVGGAHQRPLRTADARRRSGRGPGAADRLGAPRRAGPRTAPPAPDGLDHRAPRARPHRRRAAVCG